MMPAVRHTLDQLTAGMLATPPGIELTDITLDSRSVSPGSLFLACGGRSTHGLRYARQAIERGARAILYDRAGPGAELAAEVTAAGADRNDSGTFIAGLEHLERHTGLLADRFFDHPSQALTVAGITGTNGKTTCAWLLAQALRELGRPAGYLGTLGYGIPPTVTPTGHTTPDVVSVHRQLAELRELGAECVGMEVTSHAMDQERVAAVRFSTAAFTNLTRDHLDYHGTMEAYGAAKARLLQWPTLRYRIINVDDGFGRELAAQAALGRLIITSRTTLPAQSLSQAQFVRAVRVQAEPTGLVLQIESSWGNAALNAPLVGDFNADNVLTVLAVLLAWDTPLPHATAALASCRAPSGRMELFGGTGPGPLAIVDFAHTPDGLQKALRAARAHCRGRLRVVFGCGGDRDLGKRPLMGSLAVELADQVILTDDNPRTEDPARIVHEILAGVPNTAAVVIEHDRARAIQLALRDSGPGDVVLVAGKGHEDYQIYGTTRRPFSDQQVIAAQLQRVAP